MPEGRVGLAVSGGADSLALLVLAQRAIPGRIEVATVDHGLRAGAAAECAMVQALCTRCAVTCRTLTVMPAPGNVQDQARQARYAALGAWAAERGLAAIATAHHADDQAETLLMRLARGSGPRGLAGIRATSRVAGCAVPVVRPLLGFRRAELAELVAAAGLTPASDPSNQDDRFERVRVRRWLQGQDWLDPAALARSAHLMGEAEDALRAIADAAWLDTAQPHEDGVIVAASPLREINLRLLERGLGELGSAAVRSDLAVLLDRLEEPPGRANLAGVLVSLAGGRFIFRREPPRRGT